MDYANDLLKGSVKQGWRGERLQLSDRELNAMKEILHPLRELNSNKNNAVWDELSGITSEGLGYANLHTKT